MVDPVATGFPYANQGCHHWSFKPPLWSIVHTEVQALQWIARAGWRMEWRWTLERRRLHPQCRARLASSQYSERHAAGHRVYIHGSPAARHVPAHGVGWPAGMVWTCGLSSACDYVWCTTFGVRECFNSTR